MGLVGLKDCGAKGCLTQRARRARRVRELEERVLAAMILYMKE